MRQGAGNLDAIRDDGQVAPIAEKLDQVVGRGAGVEGDAVAIFDQLSRPASDAAFRLSLRSRPR